MRHPPRDDEQPRHPHGIQDFGDHNCQRVSLDADVDALTVSMARGVAATDWPAVAATALAVAVLVTTGMKLGEADVVRSLRMTRLACSPRPSCLNDSLSRQRIRRRTNAT